MNGYIEMPPYAVLKATRTLETDDPECYVSGWKRVNIGSAKYALNVEMRMTSYPVHIDYDGLVVDIEATSDVPF